MKPIPILLVVVATLSAAALTYLHLEIGRTQEQLKQQTTQTEAHVAELRSKNSDSAAQIETLKKSIAEQDDKLKDTKSKLSATDNQSDQQGRALTQVLAQLTARVEADQVFATEISQIKPEIAQLKVSVAAVTPDMITALTTTTSGLQAKVSELEDAAAKAAARAKLPTVASNGVPLSAEVTSSLIKTGNLRLNVVNVGKKNAFVVIQSGSSQEIQAGQHFIISRDGGVIAEAVASSIQDNYIIAQVVPASIKGSIRKGDTAISSQ